MKKVMVINGPNMNLLGVREKNIYGEDSLESINRWLREEGENWAWSWSSSSPTTRAPWWMPSTRPAPGVTGW